MPAAAPTLSRIMNASNGLVCSSWHLLSWLKRPSMPQYGVDHDVTEAGRPEDVPLPPEEAEDGADGDERDIASTSRCRSS